MAERTVVDPAVIAAYRVISIMLRSLIDSGALDRDALHGRINAAIADPMSPEEASFLRTFLPLVSGGRPPDLSVILGGKADDEDTTS